MHKNKAFIIGTGQSINEELIESIKLESKDSYIICISDSYKLFESSQIDALVSTDIAWWNHHSDCKNLNTRKFCHTNYKKIKTTKRSESNLNSGVLALQVVQDYFKDVKEIYLFGIDLHGTHYFGEHPHPLKNTKPDRFAVFNYQFMKEKTYLDKQKIKVYNCSQISKLSCFERRIWNE